MSCYSHRVVAFSYINFSHTKLNPVDFASRKSWLLVLVWLEKIEGWKYDHQIFCRSASLQSNLSMSELSYSSPSSSNRSWSYFKWVSKGQKNLIKQSFEINSFSSMSPFNLERHKIEVFISEQNWKKKKSLSSKDESNANIKIRIVNKNLIRGYPR